MTVVTLLLSRSKFMVCGFLRKHYPFCFVNVKITNGHFEEGVARVQWTSTICDQRCECAVIWTHWTQKTSFGFLDQDFGATLNLNSRFNQNNKTELPKLSKDHWDMKPKIFDLKTTILLSLINIFLPNLNVTPSFIWSNEMSEKIDDRHDGVTNCHFWGSRSGSDVTLSRNLVRP